MLLQQYLNRLVTRTRFADNSMLRTVAREAFEYTNSAGERHVFDVYSDIQGSARTFTINLSTISKEVDTTKKLLVEDQLLHDEIRTKCEKYFGLRGWRCHFI
jgi:hypothetical protein